MFLLLWTSSKSSGCTGECAKRVDQVPNDYQSYGRRDCALVFCSYFPWIGHGPEAWHAVAGAVAGAAAPVRTIGGSIPHRPLATWLLTGVAVNVGNLVDGTDLSPVKP